ncbi:MAG: hypothetical protein IJZ29_02075 [Clostridia bacterium]|nr:hypothetical protein [Clostridia bacterium]
MNNELFVYVFTPSLSPTLSPATSINMAVNGGDNPTYSNYKLRLINSNGKFAKYIVVDFVISETSFRCYEISSIFRAFNELYDSTPTGDNTISEVSFAVGKLYTFETTDNGTIVAGCRLVDVIEITDKYVGFVRYEGGVSTIPNLMFGMDNDTSVDSHFVAFSTDRRIDKLMTADIVFKSQRSIYTSQSVLLGLVNASSKTEYGDILEHQTKLTDKDNISGSIPHGYFSNTTFEWNKIQTVAEFIDTENRSDMYGCGIFNSVTDKKLTTLAYNSIKEKQWVLRFALTPYSNTSVRVATNISDVVIKTAVSDVSILRLTFETDEQYYSLGVVDNKQTGSSTPSNVTTTTTSINEDKAMDALKIIVALLLLVLLFVVLSYIMPVIAKIMPFMAKIGQFFSDSLKRLKNSVNDIKKQSKQSNKSNNKRGKKNKK